MLSELPLLAPGRLVPDAGIFRRTLPMLGAGLREIGTYFFTLRITREHVKRATFFCSFKQSLIELISSLTMF